MPDIILHDVPEHIIALHTQQAMQEGVDLESHLLEVLQATIEKQDRQGLLQEIIAVQADMKQKYGLLPDSTPFIRGVWDE